MKKFRQAKIGVYHQNCWGSYSTEKFPTVTMKEVGPCNIVKKTKTGVYVKAVWDLRAENSTELNRYLQYLSKNKDIKKLTIIKKQGSTALISTLWKSPSSSYDVVMKNKCEYTSPVTQEGGYEIYSVVSEKPTQITRLMQELEQIGEVKLFKINKLDENSNILSLPPKQFEALRIALLYNYYSWPRRITLSGLSKHANSTRRTFQENLRKAEQRVIPTAVKKILNFDL